jgi:hypothetical protein
MKFNINNYVKVKLTAAGKAELRRQRSELMSEYQNINLGEFKLPDEDADGWSKWQLHVLMNTFGHMCVNGSYSLPFETTIKIIQEKK